MIDHKLPGFQEGYSYGRHGGMLQMKWVVEETLGFGTELDAEHNLAGLHSDIKDSDPVGAATLARVISQIAKVKSLLAGIKE
jgi:hypothetical protein